MGRHKLFLVGTIATCAVLLLIVGNLHTNPFVPAGHEGYVFERPRIFGEGGFRGVVIGPGNYGVSLWRNEAVHIDVRPQTFTEPFSILAQDDLNIAFDFHIVIKVRNGGVKEVVDRFSGEAYYLRFIQAPFRTYIREAVQAYPSRDLKAQRGAIAVEVGKQLTAYLEGTPFELINLVVGNIDYPPVVANAVERKLAAQQLLEQKETQKAIARKDAEIRVEEAKGIAEAQRIINTTLTENYLQHEAINAQITMASSPNHTTVYIPVGSNGIPLIRNVDDR